MTVRLVSDSVPLLMFFVTFANIAHSDATSQADDKIYIRGVVVTRKGVPVAGVEVRCFYLHDKYPGYSWEFGGQPTGEKGQYEFHVPSGKDYFVEAGGKKATRAKSRIFSVHPDKNITVEELVVTPATGFLKGRILERDGRPASGMLYACKSQQGNVSCRKSRVSSGSGGIRPLSSLEETERLGT